jgi:glutamine synthetase
MNTQAQKKLQQLREENVKRVKIAFTDIDGVQRGKYLSMDKFSSVLEGGAGFCDAVFGWDINDQLYDNTTFTGWHTGFPDARYRVDLETERRLPDEDNTPFYLIEFVDENDGLHAICPRSILQRVLAKAREMNIGARLAFEYEFFIFDETPHSVREKGYRNLNHLTPGNFGYSLMRTNSHSSMYHDLMDYAELMRFPIEGLHCETGPGGWEAALKYDDALCMADSASMFKTFSKTFFQDRGLMATFMAKCSMDHPGQSGHVHQSLYNLETGGSLFFDKSGEHNMSQTMRYYLAGQQHYLKPLLAMCAPNINSYTRLVKGFWAPTAATWGVDNRTTALRVIPGTEKSQRLEFRLGAADGNPYLVAAATIAAGLLGIQEQREPTAALQGNAYEQEDGLPAQYQLASNLRDAVADFQSCPQVVQMFGAPFTEHYAATRLWEVREYERQVTGWQLERYFELI